MLNKITPIKPVGNKKLKTNAKHNEDMKKRYAKYKNRIKKIPKVA